MTLEEISKKGCGNCSGCGQFCGYPDCLPPYLKRLRNEILTAELSPDKEPQPQRPTADELRAYIAKREPK